MPLRAFHPARIVPASDRTLLVRLGDRIDPGVHARLRRLLKLLDDAALPGITNLVPAYASILIHFDPIRLDHGAIEDHVRSLLGRIDSVDLPDPRPVTIPVCYGGAFGPDLDEVARLKGLTPDQVIAIHAGTTYLAYFLGFAPGFPYLGTVPAAIACPRLPAPRREVPAGSVGIAGDQTGIYPIGTLGGWRLIGRTPLRLFDIDRDPMTLVSIGDRVTFEPVDALRYAALEPACGR